MAPRKQGKVGKTAKYYRSHPEARNKKAATDKKVNQRPEQRKKRSELTVRNRKYDKKYGKSKRKDRDWDHATSSYVKSSTNRGRKNEGNR